MDKSDGEGLKGKGNTRTVRKSPLGHKEQLQN